MTIYLDTETTGLSSVNDEILEIGIVSDSGKVLFNSLVKPLNHSSWDEAEAIHGISASMVSTAPTLEELSADIIKIVTNQDIVIYNSEFDTAFLGDLLNTANSINCCMLAWSKHVGIWNDYYDSFKRFKLIDAANDVHYKWSGDAHRATSDSFACRAVWRYLKVPEERKRVDKLIEDKQLEREAKFEIDSDMNRVKIYSYKWSEYITGFLNRWWLKKDFKHWSENLRHFSTIYYAKGTAENEFSQIFFNKSYASLEMSDEFDIVFERKKDIPENLVTISYFSKAAWFQAQLKACACFSSKVKCWPLYNTSEQERIEALYPLRFYKDIPKGECLYTKTELKKKGFSFDDVNSLEPFREEQNGFSQEWYYLYSLSNKKIDSILKNKNMVNAKKEGLYE